MVKQEFGRLISNIESTDHFMAGFKLAEYVNDYNRLLWEVQSLNPDNNFIQQKTPIKYDPLFVDSRQVLKTIVSHSRAIIENLSSKANTQPQQIHITIGTLHGNFSFDNLISTIQNSNIGNSTEVIQYITEFKQELNKTNPDKNKLRKLIDRLENVGDGVVSALIFEVGKKILGF